MVSTQASTHLHMKPLTRKIYINMSTLFDMTDVKKQIYFLQKVLYSVITKSSTPHHPHQLSATSATLMMHMKLPSYNSHIEDILSSHFQLYDGYHLCKED